MSEKPELDRHDLIVTIATGIAGVLVGFLTVVLVKTERYWLAPLPALAMVAWFAYRFTDTSIVRQIQARTRRHAREAK